MSDDEPELLIPFVVCVDHGGPFDTDAYTAGFEMGVVHQRCRTMESLEVPAMMFTIRRANLPQADLIAMHHGFILSYVDQSELDEETRERWVSIVIGIDKLD